MFELNIFGDPSAASVLFYCDGLIETFEQPVYLCADLSQFQLETVIPRDSATHVMIVSGKHRAQVCCR